MNKKILDSRISEAEEGDVESARDLLAEVEYSLAFSEPLSEDIRQYLRSKIRLILNGEDANRAFNLIHPAGRPYISAKKALLIVNAVIDKVEKGDEDGDQKGEKRSFPSAIGKLYSEGRFTEATKKGKIKSLSEKTLTRIAKFWLPKLYPGRLEHWEKTKPWKQQKTNLDKK